MAGLGPSNFLSQEQLVFKGSSEPLRCDLGLSNQKDPLNFFPLFFFLLLLSFPGSVSGRGLWLRCGSQPRGAVNVMLRAGQGTQ